MIDNFIRYLFNHQYHFGNLNLIVVAVGVLGLILTLLYGAFAKKPDPLAFVYLYFFVSLCRLCVDLITPSSTIIFSTETPSNLSGDVKGLYSPKNHSYLIYEEEMQSGRVSSTLKTHEDDLFIPKTTNLNELPTYKAVYRGQIRCKEMLRANNLYDCHQALVHQEKQKVIDLASIGNQDLFLEVLNTLEIGLKESKILNNVLIQSYKKCIGKNKPDRIMQDKCIRSAGVARETQEINIRCADPSQKLKQYLERCSVNRYVLKQNRISI